MAHRADVFTKDASFTKIFRKLGHHGDGETHFDPIDHFNVSGESWCGGQFCRKGNWKAVDLTSGSGLTSVHSNLSVWHHVRNTYRYWTKHTYCSLLLGGTVKL